MPYDRNGLEILGREECLRLLASAPIGRIGLSSGALPLVLPVNFVLDGDQVIVRTLRGSKYSAALRNTVVAFEVDEYDPAYHTGWSVLVTGATREVTDDDDIARINRLPLRRWADAFDGHRDRLVGIALDVVSGRRVVHPVPPRSDRSGHEVVRAAWST